MDKVLFRRWAFGLVATLLYAASFWATFFAEGGLILLGLWALPAWGFMAVAIGPRRWLE